MASTMQRITISITRPLRAIVVKAMKETGFFPSVSDFFRVAAEQMLRSIGMETRDIIDENEVLMNKKKATVMKDDLYEYVDQWGSGNSNLRPLTISITKNMKAKVKEAVKQIKISSSYSEFYRTAVITMIKEMGYLRSFRRVSMDVTSSPKRAKIPNDVKDFKFDARRLTMDPEVARKRFEMMLTRTKVERSQNDQV